MAETITFVHMADAHIGAPFRGFRALSEPWAALAQSAIIEAFERMVETALDRQVDFVVMAGDAFDLARPSYGDKCRFFEGLHKLHEAGIPAYLVAGNHDPYVSWQRDIDLLPPSAHVLGIGKPTFELYEREGVPLCLIGGRSFYNQVWAADEDIAAGLTREAAVRALSTSNPVAASAPFAIGVIHTGFTIDTSKAPVNPSTLENAGMDYWACGHVHKRHVYPSNDNPHIVFPGCLQSRDIKESGEKGCYVVTLEEGAPCSLEFVPTASIAFETLKVDVAACATLADIVRLITVNLIKANGKAHCEHMIVRVILQGVTGLHGYLSREEVLDDMRKEINDAYPGFFCDALVDRTQAPLDRDAVRAEGLFTSVAAAVADEQRARSDEMVNYVQSEFVKRGISVPSALARRIGEFEKQAESLVLDLLAEDAE